MSDCNEAIRLDPHDALAYRYRGLAYSFMGQDAEAIDDYTKIIGLNPRDATAYNRRALAHNNLGQYE